LLAGEEVTRVGVDHDRIGAVPCVNVDPFGEGTGTKKQEGA
jgi:hypothetical protein